MVHDRGHRHYTAGMTNARRLNASERAEWRRQTTLNLSLIAMLVMAGLVAVGLLAAVLFTGAAVQGAPNLENGRRQAMTLMLVSVVFSGLAGNALLTVWRGSRHARLSCALAGVAFLIIVPLGTLLGAAILLSLPRRQATGTQA